MQLKEFHAHMIALLDPGAVDAVDRATNGVQVGRADREITRVAFAVDACLETIRRAAEWGADLLFVHHGLFWGEARAITDNHYDRVRELITSELSLYAMPLPLDMHPSLGNNAGLADLLGLGDRQGFGEYHGLQIGIRGVLDPAASVRDLAERIVDARLLPLGPERVASVAVVSGAAPRIVTQAMDLSIDCFVTGEFSHELYHDCMERGINVIVGGHYSTEVHGVQRLAEHVRENLDLETVFLDVPTGM